MAKTDGGSHLNATNVGAFGEFMKTIKKYGFFKTMLSLLAFSVFSMILYIASDPSVMFRKYEKYSEEKHAQLNEYRMESSPLIRNYLNGLSKEIGAERVYIVEYHNGKSNPSGLQWQFGDMNFINDNTDDIRDEFQNISLVRYNIFYELYENVYWSGSLEELRKLDKRFAARAEVNEVQYLAFETIYGSNLADLGFLGVSFTEEPKISESEIRKALNKYSATISPLLDARKAINKK